MSEENKITFVLPDRFVAEGNKEQNRKNHDEWTRRFFWKHFDPDNPPAPFRVFTEANPFPIDEDLKL